MWNCPPARILVAVDFGAASGRAVEVASFLASAVGGDLRVLHAEHFEAPAYFTHDQVAQMERERAVWRAKATDEVARFASQHGVGVADVLLAETAPDSAIVDASRTADLVVIGTHGRRGPARWWMGSVAERVVAASHAPVLVVRAEEAAGVPADVFQHPMVVDLESGFDGGARRVAAGLSGIVGGGLVEDAATCEADLARARRATMIVVPPTVHQKAWGGPAGRWLRTCTLPMLFVPAA
jgi:nucleotide-binding universal stress UspA family protein